MNRQTGFSRSTLGQMTTSRNQSMQQSFWHVFAPESNDVSTYTSTFSLYHSSLFRHRQLWSCSSHCRSVSRAGSCESRFASQPHKSVSCFRGPQARICPPQLSPVEAGLLYDFPRNMIRSNGARLLIIMPLLCALASGVKTPFLLLGEDTIQQRLDLYKGNDSIREAALLKLFTEAGCQTANLSE